MSKIQDCGESQAQLDEGAYLAINGEVARRQHHLDSRHWRRGSRSSGGLRVRA